MSKPKTLDFDPYHVLGLEPSCSENDVDKSYKKMALKWHPDKAIRNGISKDESEAMFVKIYQAFEFLKDAASRTAYDDERAAKAKRKEFEDSRRAQNTERRQKFMDKLSQRETAFENRKRKADNSLSKDELLEKLRKEGAAFLARRARQKESTPEAPKQSTAPAPETDGSIYKMSAKDLRDLEEAELAGL